MALSDLVQDWLFSGEKDWICARDVVEKTNCPMSSATSVLSTLEKVHPEVERQYFRSGDVKRPVWHYRKIPRKRRH